MKNIILFGAFLILSTITNKGFSQTNDTDLEATVISVSSDKITGSVYSPVLGNVIEFVNEKLIDVSPGDKVLIIKTNNGHKAKITFKAKEGATHVIIDDINGLIR